MIKTWNWNNFKGGLSDNPYLGPEGSFQNGSYGIDINSEPIGFKLASKMKQKFTTTGQPITQLFYNNYHYVFCSNGAIYLNGTLKYAHNEVPASTMGAIYGAEIMNVGGTDFIFMFSAGAIHKGSLDLNTVTTSVASFTSNATRKLIKNYGGDLYFTSKNLFYRYTSTEVLTTLYTSANKDLFTGLTFFQDQFKLYVSSNYGSLGKQIIISFSDLTVAEYISEFSGLPILGAINNGPNDYVIAGPSNADLYLFSGTQKQVIKSNLDGFSKYRTFTQDMAIRFDDIYISGTGGVTGANNNGGLFRYGSEFVGFPNNLSMVSSLAGLVISTLCPTLTGIYIGGLVGSNYYVYFYEFNSYPNTDSYYADSGEIVSNIMDFGIPYNRKTIEQIDIAYSCNSSELLPKGGTITIYCRTIASGNWTTIKASTLTDTGNIRITKNQLNQLGIGDFYSIEFKIKLEPALDVSNNNAYTPLVKGIKITYEDGIKI